MAQMGADLRRSLPTLNLNLSLNPLLNPNLNRNPNRVWSCRRRWPGIKHEGTETRRPTCFTAQLGSSAPLAEMQARRRGQAKNSALRIQHSAPWESCQIGPQ